MSTAPCNLKPASSGICLRAFGGQRCVRSSLAAVYSPRQISPRCRRSLSVVAALGGEKEDDKKFITREEEPDQFWQTKTEKKGQNPAKDPLAIIGILGLLIPFIILGIAIGTGVVDVNAGK